MSPKRGPALRLAQPFRLFIQRFAFLSLVLASFGLMVFGKADPEAVSRIRATVTDTVTPILDALSRPTEAGAKALVERIRAGTSLEAAAADAGFSVSSGDLRDKDGMASSTSFALAEAVFDADRGGVVSARSTLGFYVARIDDIERTPARTLAQARDEIAEQLRNEVRAGELIELSSQIEEKVDTGTSLGDVAEEFGLEVNVIPG